MHQIIGLQRFKPVCFVQEGSSIRKFVRENSHCQEIATFSGELQKSEMSRV
jgi:hypothetical protein